MRTTTSGQLALLMLIERFYLNKFKVISANTDGVVVLFDKQRLSEFREIQREWESVTKFQLEETFYDLLVMSNVNNYLAIKSDGKVKHKGWFEIEKLPHKNHSMMIVAKALHEYYVNGTDYRSTVYNCTDIFDFCKAVKAPRGAHFELHSVLDGTNEVEYLNRTVRYFVSNKGGKLIKKLPPLKESVYENTLFDGVFTQDRSIGIESKHLITYFNKYEKKEFLDYDVNYDYYIKEIEKIIKPIDKTNV